MNLRASYAISCCLLLSMPVSAAVLDAADGGFTIEHSVELAVDRAEAWSGVVQDVGEWWNPAHTMSGDASKLYIDPVPLGCFCESLGDAAAMVHLQVTFVNPGVLLRMSGGLGPLGLMGAHGNLTFEFEPHAERAGHTIVTLRYAVGGYRAGGMAALAGPVDAVLGEALQRYAEHLGGAIAAPAAE